ncbi:MarR family winged helix-turn-helix transcriptional regulator [Amycolatopsis sp. BJA-103]|uniref:MarR family winged helix-turn-helix transcriptional regulator n=1 Tax=unclassified Amycolatopsis TaxID=2618356 RepID=UPI000C770BFF|nr:MarR family winged helix-turn-helix transcriptional regulator [Amycolatopsis sp. BJA-103]AUI59959.1 MarR family transcriptional regulator [Amycolatopsis sp. BJA-103]PNE13691.1 MarR family transcriptional regulator [Amycolatopsis sp. BJA-103]
MSELPVVNQPPHRCGALLDHVTRRIRLRSESVLAPLGLRPRHLVALTVLRDLAGCSQQDLAKTLEMDSTNVVGLLNDLESANLIERRRSPEDRRRHIVELTDVGAKQLAKAEFALAGVEDDVLGALDVDQREALYNLLYQATSRTETGACVEAAHIDDC